MLDEEKEVTDSNEIIEIDETEEIVYDKETEEEPVKKTPKKKKRKINLSKKQKILIICGVCVVVIVILVLVLYFVLWKNKEEETTYEPEVIVVKKNSRYEDGTLIFLDNAKNELGKYECVNKDEKKCFIANYSNEDSFDVTQKVYENNQSINEISDIYHNKYVFIYDNAINNAENIILYDIKENNKVEEYSLVKKINNDLVIVKKDDSYGILKLDDNVTKLIDFTYDYLGFIPEKAHIVAKKNNNSKLIDLAGNDISKEILGDIKNYNDSFISIKDNNSYKLYDYKGEERLTKDSDYYTFVDEYIFLINNKKMYAYDNNLNLLNYEGIKLNSNNYNKKIIFDEDLKEVSREDSFTIEASNSSIRISELNNVLKEINVYEGKLNGQFKYVSYYDGILYLFTDEEKSNILGKYTCDNPNKVTSNTQELENCFIGKEDLLLNRTNNSEETSYLPIFNKRFVFINDTSNKNEYNIILYDLSKSNPLEAKLATYRQVDAGFYETIKGTDFVTTTDRVIMAQNTSGNYGLIKIEANSVGGLIAFLEKQDSNNSKKENILGNTKMIKYLGNNILVKRDDNHYVVYDKTGDKVLGYATNEIVDINSKALVTKNNDSYTVSDVYGGQIIKANLLYVDLQPNYFIFVDKLRAFDIYDYSSRDVFTAYNYIVPSEITDFSKCYELVDDYTIIINDRDWKIMR